MKKGNENKEPISVNNNKVQQQQHQLKPKNQILIACITNNIYTMKVLLLFINHSK